MCTEPFYNAYDPSPYCVSHNSKMSADFESAVTHCKKLGGHVWEFSSKKEMAAVEKFFRTRASGGLMWIGLKKGT